MNIFSSKYSFKFGFLIIILYWIYLIFSTTPQVVFDAVGYLESGQILYTKGWSGFFASGPHREPLFPMIISWSLGLQQLTALPYHIFCKIILLFFYALTIAGVYQLMMLMGAQRRTALWACIYLGISPALLNSNLWLWSEAASYPWVIGIVLLSIKLWQSINECHPTPKVMRCAFFTAVAFFLLTMVKSMAAIIFVIYILPFIAMGIHCALKRDAQRLVRIFLGLLMMGGVYFIAIDQYKNLNYRYNGHYAITFQNPGVLFGNTARRLVPLTQDRVLQAVLFVPRLGFCQEFYRGECFFWGMEYSDEITKNTAQKMQELGLNSEERKAFFMSESLRLIQKHPIQEFFMTSLEASKMFFWETKLFFVNYPKWLDQLHCTPLIVVGLSFTWALLSIFGLILGMKQGWRLREVTHGVAFFSTSYFIVCFMACYSLFFVDLRYALSIAPLFVALAFCALERLFRVSR